MNGDYSKAPPKTIREIIREAESYIDAQVTLGTSADQRASVMASVYAAAGTVIAGALIALASAPDPARYLAVYWGGGVTAAAFIIAASFCVKATMPTGFYLPGSQPQSWLGDIRGNIKLVDSLRDQAANFQEKIESNRQTLDRNAWWFRLGAFTGIASPFAGLIVWAIVSCWGPHA